MVNIARIFLIMLNNLPQMRLKLFQKEQFKKEQKKLMILLVKQLLIKSQKLKLKKYLKEEERQKFSNNLDINIIV